MHLLFVMVETKRSFPMFPTLQTFCLLKKNGCDFMLRGFRAFKVTTAVLAQRTFGAASSNDAPCFTSVFESVLVTNVSPFLQDRETRKGGFQHLIELPSAIFVWHMRCAFGRTGTKAISMAACFIGPLQNFNPGEDGFCQLK